ncbi:hypothetical protein [Aureimonas psammosilenae]|uniref:hypothetical protein n=1 Tax=Aureimonas psammosilenae TaxID=2495496 RepID=UPI0012608CAC|nr:hypothetical protein [Aureimonas psammosilenae]
MTNDVLEQIAHDLSGDLLNRVKDAGGRPEDAILATEALCAYVLNALVVPGNDHDVIEDVTGGIAIALVQARKAAPAETRH